MEKSRLKKFIPTALILTAILGAISYAALVSEVYWLAALAFFWLCLSLYRQYQYYSKAEYELLEVPKKANKGMWKAYLIFIAVTMLAATVYAFFEFSEVWLQYIAIALSLIFFGYFIWRYIKAYKQAKTAIKNRMRDENSE